MDSLDERTPERVWHYLKQKSYIRYSTGLTEEFDQLIKYVVSYSLDHTIRVYRNCVNETEWRALSELKTFLETLLLNGTPRQINGPPLQTSHTHPFQTLQTLKEILGKIYNTVPLSRGHYLTRMLGNSFISLV